MGESEINKCFFLCGKYYNVHDTPISSPITLQQLETGEKNVACWLGLWIMRGL